MKTYTVKFTFTRDSDEIQTINVEAENREDAINDIKAEFQIGRSFIKSCILKKA